MKTMILVILTAAITNNYVLVKFLGICPFLGVSKKLDQATGMSLAVIFVEVLATAVTWPIYHFLLAGKVDFTYMETVVFILVIAALVQLVEIVLKRYVPALHKSLGVYLPLITTNCGVLGVTMNVISDGNMNYERLLSLSPDIVLLFGVSGASAMEPKLRELGIPYAYMGEYLEQSPLGKAEWLVAVAEIAGMRERGEEVFREIPLRYDSLKTLAAKAERKPVVMLNTPYGDSWLMAPPSSYVARLIADAGGQYVYTQDTGNQSRPIDTEEAYRLAEMSDCWINVGSAASLKELAEIVPKFMDTRPVREGRVYNNNRRTNPSGGNDYWESGVIHPDLILQDLIRIFHPELTDAEPTYYRKLN